LFKQTCRNINFVVINHFLKKGKQRHCRPLAINRNLMYFPIEMTLFSELNKVFMFEFNDEGAVALVMDVAESLLLKHSQDLFNEQLEGASLMEEVNEEVDEVGGEDGVVGMFTYTFGHVGHLAEEIRAVLETVAGDSVEVGGGGVEVAAGWVGAECKEGLARFEGVLIVGEQLL
jgi:hypothetical protein